MISRNLKTDISFILMAFGSLLLMGCSCSGGKNRTDIELFHDMIQQRNVKTQEGEGEQTLMLHPPENTIARNIYYYPYKGNLKGAEEELKNPFKKVFSAYVIGMGKRQYEKACIYCHGAMGRGEGLVAEKMAVKPPSLLTDKALTYSDGRLYHIIHEGQGLMGAYRKQVPGEEERWALVNYIRLLQKQGLEKEEKK